MLNESTQLDKTFLALSDPTRRLIIKRLMKGRAKITDIARPFEISLNAVSKHIKKLEEAGLVRREVAWREHFVSFNPAPIEELSQWIEKQRDFWNERLDNLESILKAEDAAKRRTRKGRRK